MSVEALDKLRSVFGYTSFREPQEAIIDVVGEGDDALVVMPTGSGKSLCYQIPALLRQGTAIVISPLIALMKDQVSALDQLGVCASYLNSSLGPLEQAEVERRLADGALDLLYVAPERLLQERTLDLLSRCDLALFAIDEAHCVSQWGHDFRPEYMELSIIAERFPGVPRIALTATADERTRNEIAERLGLDSARRFIGGFDRPNITYRVAERQRGREQLLRFVRTEHADHAGIVYCLSRRSVDETAAWLREQGFDALPYHAGMSKEDRDRNQQRFQREDRVVIVATIAFGMGIDKPDVRFVAHLDLPGSIEAYYQETGRAGRDGLPADAWMVYGLQDVVKRRQMLEGSDAPEERKRIERRKLDDMLGYCEITTCRRQALLRYFGETLREPCGNCDVCIAPPETWDATEVVQKALSAVYRTGQRFGVVHTIDVLRGSENARIHRFRHDRLSTYGVGADLSVNEWRTVFRQLIARGLLEVDIEGHGGLRLTPACRPILRGEQTIELRKDRVSVAARKSSEQRQISPDDEPLWEALRAKRKELADEQGVPAYVIFHDATLLEMLASRPSSMEAMRALPGVGDAKLARYGQAFLAIIAEQTGDERTVET
jgi:ATP-dependent DNA helicase RecQ